MNHIACFDFTGIYENLRGREPREGSLYYHIDCCDIPGTRGYCDPEAAKEILARMERAGAPLPDAVLPKGDRLIRLIDNGNYHYLSHLLSQGMNEPFALILIDHHPDLREPAFSQGSGMTQEEKTNDTQQVLLSCGGWVLSALRKNRHLRQILMIGVDKTLFEEEYSDMKAGESAGESAGECAGESAGERIPVSRVASDTEDASEILRRVREMIPPELPVYLSVDKDVLSKEEISTNWDQGEMTLQSLREIVAGIGASFLVKALDLCGAPDARTASFAEIETSHRIDEELIGALR